MSLTCWVGRSSYGWQTLHELGFGRGRGGEGRRLEEMLEMNQKTCLACGRLVWQADILIEKNQLPIFNHWGISHKYENFKILLGKIINEKTWQHWAFTEAIILLIVWLLVKVPPLEA